MQKIVSILLASSAPQDVITWRGDNTGDYTAKTGYSWLNTAEGTNIQSNLLSKFYKKKMRNKGTKQDQNTSMESC